jgi:signal transduction histidine kinase
MTAPDRPPDSAGIDAFLRSLVHTLRTPVSVTLAWVTLLRGDRLDPAQRSEALAAIEESAREQGRVIDRLGDAARLLGGRVGLDRQATDMAALLEESVALIGERAAERGVHVRCDASGISGCTAAVDADRLRQALSHLFANALNATRRGGAITISSRLSDDRIAIAVGDDGCGIDPRLLPHCFASDLHAVRAELERSGDATLAAGGVGLGLMMVRRIAELHGGHASLESDGVGRGATATITLPLTDGTIA